MPSYSDVRLSSLKTPPRQEARALNTAAQGAFGLRQLAGLPSSVALIRMLNRPLTSVATALGAATAIERLLLNGVRFAPHFGHAIAPCGSPEADFAGAKVRGEVCQAEHRRPAL